MMTALSFLADVISNCNNQSGLPRMASVTRRPITNPEPMLAGKMCCRQDPAIRDGLSISGFGQVAAMSGVSPRLQGPGGYPGSAWRWGQSDANLSPLVVAEAGGA
jgi:hypothetical protein